MDTPIEPPKPEIMNAGELTRYLGYHSRATVLRLIREGAIPLKPYDRFGRPVYKRSEADEFLASLLPYDKAIPR